MPPRKKKREDGRYQAKVIVGYDETGKSITKHVYAKTQGELDTKKQKAKEKAANIQFIDIDTYLMSKLLDDFLAKKKNGKNKVRQNTYDSYESPIRVHIKPKLGGLPVGKVDAPAIIAFLEAKREAGCSDRDIRYFYIILNAAFKMIKLKDNPCNDSDLKDLVKSPKKKKEINVFSQEQINLLLETAAGWQRTAFFLGWGTGFRREEILGVRWQDIDFSKGTVSVNKTVIYTKESGVIIEDPKNDASYRTIPVQKEILNDLKKHKAIINEQRLSMLTYRNNDLVFPMKDGSPRDPRQFSKDFKAVVRKANLPDKFHLHDLRHTHATQLLKLGIHPKVVQYRLGHASFQQTMDTYSHVAPQMQDGIADMLSGLLNTKKESQ